MAGAAWVFGGVIERYPGINFACATVAASCLIKPDVSAAFKVRPRRRARLHGVAAGPFASLLYDMIVHARRAPSSPRRGREGALARAATIPAGMGEFGAWRA